MAEFGVQDNVKNLAQNTSGDLVVCSGSVSQGVIDFHPWYVKRDDGGFITEVAMCFSEGGYQNISVADHRTGLSELKSVYVRTKRLGDVDEGFIEERAKVKNSKGQDFCLYTPTDFGNIKTNEELWDFMKQELKKDEGRIPISEQA